MLITARPCVLAALLALSVPGISAFQPTKSASPAKQLTDALDAAKLDAVAAADPSDPGASLPLSISRDPSYWSCRQNMQRHRS